MEHSGIYFSKDKTKFMRELCLDLIVKWSRIRHFALKFTNPSADAIACRRVEHLTPVCGTQAC